MMQVLITHFSKLVHMNVNHSIVASCLQSAIVTYNNKTERKNIMSTVWIATAKKVYDNINLVLMLLVVLAVASFVVPLVIVAPLALIAFLVLWYSIITCIRIGYPAR